LCEHGFGTRAESQMDVTLPAIVYQVVLFLVLYFVLKSLVFDRFLANLEARHHHTRGALDEAAKLREEAASLAADYESQMAKIRHEAAAAREEIRREGEQAERDLLETARREAAQTLATARARIADEARATKVALEAETEPLAERILDTLLKRA